eukprot:gene798-biopygen2613
MRKRNDASRPRPGNPRRAPRHRAAGAVRRVFAQRGVFRDHPRVDKNVARRSAGPRREDPPAQLLDSRRRGALIVALLSATPGRGTHVSNRHMIPARHGKSSLGETGRVLPKVVLGKPGRPKVVLGKKNWSDGWASPGGAGWGLRESWTTGRELSEKQPGAAIRFPKTPSYTARGTLVDVHDDARRDGRRGGACR